MRRQLMSSHLKKKMSKGTHKMPTHNHLDETSMTNLLIFCLQIPSLTEHTHLELLMVFVKIIMTK